VTIYLVRHARAGDRGKWSKPDQLRPLSKVGRRQAAGVVDVVIGDAGADAGGTARITHVLSSPYVRCVQTVEPLADRLGLAVERADTLTEGARGEDALPLVEKFADTNAVLCMHGDVLPEILEHLARRGLLLPHDRVEKGSTWALDFVDGTVTTIRYFAPSTPA
jgi:phosphohistidine phosphatase SixA